MTTAAGKNCFDMFFSVRPRRACVCEFEGLHRPINVEESDAAIYALLPLGEGRGEGLPHEGVFCGTLSGSLAHSRRRRLCIQTPTDEITTSAPNPQAIHAVQSMPSDGDETTTSVFSPRAAVSCSPIVASVAPLSELKTGFLHSPLTLEFAKSFRNRQAHLVLSGKHLRSGMHVEFHRPVQYAKLAKRSVFLREDRPPVLNRHQSYRLLRRRQSRPRRRPP